MEYSKKTSRNFIEKKLFFLCASLNSLSIWLFVEIQHTAGKLIKISESCCMLMCSCRDDFIQRYYWNELAHKLKHEYINES